MKAEQAASDAKRQRGDMNDVDCTKGLHLAKDRFQIRYQLQQCEQIVNNWDQLYRLTHESAPVRMTDFQLRRPKSGNVSMSSGELRWERALWCTWGPGIDYPAGEFIPNLCKSIVTYQMPLKKHRDDKGWGNVDLIGQRDSRPVLMELKRGDAASEMPLRAIVEILAYGIAFKKAWSNDGGNLAAAWCELLDVKPFTIANIPVVVLGTGDYWKKWKNSMQSMSNPIKKLIELSKKKGPDYTLCFCKLWRRISQAALSHILN